MDLVPISATTAATGRFAEVAFFFRFHEKSTPRAPSNGCTFFEPRTKPSRHPLRDRLLFEFNG
jgi:hypothetical protein